MNLCVLVVTGRLINYMGCFCLSDNILLLGFLSLLSDPADCVVRRRLVGPSVQVQKTKFTLHMHSVYMKIRGGRHNYGLNLVDNLV